MQRNDCKILEKSKKQLLTLTHFSVSQAVTFIQTSYLTVSYVSFAAQWASDRSQWFDSKRQNIYCPFLLMNQ